MKGILHQNEKLSPMTFFSLHVSSCYTDRMLAAFLVLVALVTVMNATTDKMLFSVSPC